MTLAVSRRLRGAAAPARFGRIAARVAQAGRRWLEGVRKSIGRAGRTLREGLARDLPEEVAPVQPAGPAFASRPRPDATDPWETRARTAEARATELELRLAKAEQQVLDLRSRNVCLQGKLAAAHATARYQNLALELDAQSAPSEGRRPG